MAKRETYGCVWMWKMRAKKKSGDSSCIYIQRQVCVNVLSALKEWLKGTGSWQMCGKKWPSPGRELQTGTFLWEAPAPASPVAGQARSLAGRVWTGLQSSLIPAASILCEVNKPQNQRLMSWLQPDGTGFLEPMTFSGSVSEEVCKVEKITTVSNRNVLPLLSWIETN